jgi:hypothetical protein
MASHAPSLVRISVTTFPVDVSWYFNHPAFPYVSLVSTHAGRKTSEKKNSADNSRQKEMVAKELHLVDFEMVSQLMYLDSITVVDVNILLLRHCEKGKVV